MWQCQLSGVLLVTGRKHPDAAAVDHIIPYQVDPSLALEPTNLWAISKHAHETICASIERRNLTPQEIRKAKLSCGWVGLDGYRVTIERHADISLTA